MSGDVLQPRFPGSRWKILFGARQGIEKFALEELYRAIQVFTPYVVETRPAELVRLEDLSGHVIFLGTPESNPHLRALLIQAGISLPDHAEGFAAASFPASWDPTARAVVIAGGTGVGILNGVETFIARILAGLSDTPNLEGSELHARLDGLPEFVLRESPVVRQRGIWTWGYVIYDYRRFLDHMARLRMNLITIWNDTPPLNAADVIEYAHERGIRVVLGFPWGWGKDYDLVSPSDQQQIEDEVVNHFLQKIAPLHPDGIYFQTLTEHNSTEIGGRSVAAVTCEIVNRIASHLLTLAAGLEIQFGLHATSIQGNFADFENLDPRVAIVWEDAGALPYTYIPQLEFQGKDITETLRYSQALAKIRPGQPFGLVPKGWTNLNWASEFEHHADYLLGVRTPGYIRDRLRDIQPRWDLVNDLWREEYPHALHFYRSLAEITGGNMIVQALIEDGLFEEIIQHSVALYAEMLWDPNASAETILTRAESRYYQGIL